MACRPNMRGCGLRDDDDYASPDHHDDSRANDNDNAKAYLHVLFR